MTGGNRVQAARALRVSVRTLYRKLKAYGVDELEDDRRSGVRGNRLRGR